MIYAMIYAIVLLTGTIFFSAPQHVTVDLSNIDVKGETLIVHSPVKLTIVGNNVEISEAK